MNPLPPPKLRLETPLGEIEMTIEDADRVALRGTVYFQSSHYQVFTELKKSDGNWTTPDGPAVRDEKFQANILQPIIASFQNWADTHPNIFQFAKRVREAGKNRQKPRSKSARKNVTPNVTPDGKN